MNIKHHISDELLLDYATGSLSEGWRIAVATHLALCPSCRRRLAPMELAGGALLARHPAGTDDRDANGWDAMKKRLENETPRPSEAPEPAIRLQSSDVVLPEPLRSYVGSDVDGVKWRSLGRGAFHLPIPIEDKSTIVRLLRIPAGKPVPEHGHRGRELTLVLSGSFHDGDALFARGDFEEADEHLEHQPIATEGQDCICLAVTDAPLRFTSWLVRLVQPIIGI